MENEITDTLAVVSEGSGLSTIKVLGLNVGAIAIGFLGGYVIVKVLTRNPRKLDEVINPVTTDPS